MVDVLLKLRITLGCNADDDGVTGLNLLDVRKGLLVNALLRSESDDRDTFDNQGQRAVLELTCRICLGMDVGTSLSFSAPSRATS